MQASREHYCVNKAVTSKPSISEECDKLMRSDGMSCSYHSNFTRLLGPSLADKLKVIDLAACLFSLVAAKHRAASASKAWVLLACAESRCAGS